MAPPARYRVAVCRNRNPVNDDGGVNPNPDYSAISMKIHLFFTVSAPAVLQLEMFIIIFRSAPKPLKWLSIGVLIATGCLFLAAAVGAFAGAPGLVQRIACFFRGLCPRLCSCLA